MFFRIRVCYHEAAHFLCGYCVGLPVKTYGLGSDGNPQVEFFDTKTGDLPDSQKGQGVEFNEAQVAKLAVVSMAGAVGEALEMEEAKGGENDLIALQNIFGRSEEFMGAAKQQEVRVSRGGLISGRGFLLCKTLTRSAFCR